MDRTATRLRIAIEAAQLAATKVCGRDYPLEGIEIVVRAQPGEPAIFESTACHADELLALLDGKPEDRACANERTICLPKAPGQKPRKKG